MPLGTLILWNILFHIGIIANVEIQDGGQRYWVKQELRVTMEKVYQLYEMSHVGYTNLPYLI